MVYNIHIQINRTSLYQVNVTNPLSNKVFLDEPYDQLSKKFNRSTHKINYKEDYYDPDDYVLCLDDPNAWYYYYILFLHKPDKKIVSVEIFFQSNDKGKRYPLIFGFNYENDPSVYYTYYHLRGLKKKTGSIGRDGLIEEDDLITRLIDERGLYESESQNKFIIRLGDKPNKSEIKYPKSGKNKERITLKKSESDKYPNFVKYEHEINNLNNVQSFYISFHQDTLYMISDGRSGKLKDVDVYYNKHDGDVPVVIVFKFERHTKLYKFSDFYSDAPKKTKNISLLGLFGEGDLSETLINEYKKVKKEITFNKGKQENQYISVTSDKFFVDNKDVFRRAIIRPNLNSLKGGHPTGPYLLYNNNLFKRYSDSRIDEKILTDVLGRNFSSIYVYYTADNEPLLVCFIGESDIKFYRITKGGTTWIKEQNYINIYNLGHLLSKLRQFEREKNFSVSDVQVPVSGPSHQDGKTHPPRTPPPPPPRAPPTRPATRERELVDIDLSINSQKNYGPSSIIKVTKNEYSLSQLFCYFTHSRKDNGTFTISSFLTDNGRKKFTNIHNFIKLVKSVNVYFNKFNTKIPLLIDVTSSDNMTRYYANIIQDKQSYDFSSFKLVDKEDLTQTLIEESDRVHKTLTYQLEKTFNADGSNSYGYKDGITITQNVKTSSRFSICTHEPNKGKPSKSYVLFNHNLLVPKKSDKKNDNLNIQEKIYKNIKIYSLNNDTEFSLIIELNEDRTNKTTHLSRMDGSSLSWEKKSINLSDDKFELGLFELFYPLQNSVIIEIDKNNLTKDERPSYPMKIISNKKSSNGQYEKTKYEDAQAVKSKTVNVSDNYNLTDFRSKTKTQFYYVSHELRESDSQSIIRRDIAGVRLFISIGVGIKPEEIYFYETQDNSNRYTNRLNLYYPPQSHSKKIYVYFYDDDPRPLLVCYDGKAYKKLTDISKWVVVRKVNCSDSSDVLNILKEIYGTMKKKITLVKDGNIDNKINFKNDQPFGSFKKDIYTVKLDEKNQKTFKMPIDKLVENLKKDTSLYNLLAILINKSFDSINVYKVSNGLTMKNVLVFEFINESHTIHLQKKDIEATYWVDEQINYDNDKSLQDQLLTIKSKVEKTILYEIDKKSVNYNAYIYLETISLDYSSEYIEYSHSPQSNYDNHFGCLVYKGQRLMVKNSHSQIVPFDRIHDKPYDNVSVYFGLRKKDIPLIIEFSFSNSYSSTTYYKHIVSESTSYWESIQIRTGPSESEDLLSQLKLVESNLFQSVVILMDIRKGKYGDTKIKEAIHKLTTKKAIDTYPMDDVCISVNEMTHQSQGNCLSNSGFAMYEHNINNCIKNDHSCLLRFFIVSSSDPNKYTELSLYGGVSIERLYYSKPNEANKVYIYFYKGINNQFDLNQDNDPRPLLIFYRGVGYKPSDKNGYFDKWYKDSTITDFMCHSPRGNPYLIKALSTVVGFLNEVQLYQRPHDTYYTRDPNSIGHKTSTYEAHIFGNKQIKILASYYNGSCFRYYRHETYGINGQGDGYRLGNITHERKPIPGLRYEITKQLNAVNLYYYVYDNSHEYPLLISLEFKEGSNNEYYELDDPRDKKWRRINERVDESNIDYTIKSLIKKLQIDFRKTKESPTLFDPDECHDDNNTETIIKATSGTFGTLATVGTGVGVTAAVRPEWFIPVIRALV